MLKKTPSVPYLIQKVVIHFLASGLPCTATPVICMVLPRFTWSHWAWLLCLGIQTPKNLPRRWLCNLAKKEENWLLFIDEAVSWLLRIRFFCKPTGDAHCFSVECKNMQIIIWMKGRMLSMNTIWARSELSLRTFAGKSVTQNGGHRCCCQNIADQKRFRNERDWVLSTKI